MESGDDEDAMSVEGSFEEVEEDDEDEQQQLSAPEKRRKKQEEEEHWQRVRLKGRDYRPPSSEVPPRTTAAMEFSV